MLVLPSSRVRNIAAGHAFGLYPVRFGAPTVNVRFVVLSPKLLSLRTFPALSVTSIVYVPHSGTGIPFHDRLLHPAATVRPPEYHICVLMPIPVASFRTAEMA